MVLDFVEWWEENPSEQPVLGVGAGGDVIACALATASAVRPPTFVCLADDESAAERYSRLVAHTGLETRISVRWGELEHPSFGRAAGYWYPATLLTDLAEVDTVIIAGPGWQLGPPARQAVIAGLDRLLDSHATLFISGADSERMRKMIVFWTRTLPEGRTLEPDGGHRLDLGRTT